MGGERDGLPHWGRRCRWWFTRVLLPSWSALLLAATVVRLLDVDLSAALPVAGLEGPLTVGGLVHLAALVATGLGWLAGELVAGFREP